MDLQLERYDDNYISIENLPFKYVYYPGNYAAFFAFKEKENSPFYFCSCSKEAIINHIKLELTFSKPTYSDQSVFFVLRQGDFPQSFINHVKKENLPNSINIIDHLNFRNKLCHECNKKTPTHQYCHEYYGGVFKQKYGWYIQKQCYEYGIIPINHLYIKELCPLEILDLMQIDPIGYKKFRTESASLSWIDFSDHDAVKKKKKKIDDMLNDLIISSFGYDPFSDKLKAGHLSVAFEKQKRKINTLIENEVREKFGHKKVGEAWTSETILYYIITSLYPDKKIHRHFRPDFLNGLELDIFIEELNLGIEYQGIQHFEPVKYWGGKEAFEKLKKRDKIKEKLCRELGITLIYFTYLDELSEEFVLQEIKNSI